MYTLTMTFDDNETLSARFASLALAVSHIQACDLALDICAAHYHVASSGDYAVSLSGVFVTICRLAS